ncbi:D-alanine--D-alanine ligase, partial [bacterium]|nr:D-alanine--D-alanine ligase [bacterium]
EHEVSLKSAQSVMKTIHESGKYDIFPMGITKDGDWICGPETLERLIKLADKTLLDGVASVDRNQTCFGSGETVQSGRSPLPEVLDKIDVAFPVLHGPGGEDGTVQGMLQLARIPYVGCGVLASSVGMDKEIYKRIIKSHGIPVVPDVAFRRCEWEVDSELIIARIENSLKYPVFCKPVNMGSSVGISKCHNREELICGVSLAARFDRRILVEMTVSHAREIEVSVLGNDKPEASVPGEIIPGREFYDYTAKYIDSGKDASELLIPARLNETEIQTLRKTAVYAFRVIDGAGMARVDFLINKSSGDIYLNEINTIPGFTEISMYSKLWAATNVSYPMLIEKLIELAEERFKDQEKNSVAL